MVPYYTRTEKEAVEVVNETKTNNKYIVVGGSADTKKVSALEYFLRKAVGRKKYFR